MAYKVRPLRLPHPFVTPPRLNLQQVATRSKGALVSIGNPPPKKSGLRPTTVRRPPRRARPARRRPSLVGRALAQARDRRRADRRRGQYHHPGAHPDRARDRAGRLLPLRRRRLRPRSHPYPRPRRGPRSRTADRAVTPPSTAAGPHPTPAAPLFEAERIRSEPRRPNWTAAMVAAIVAVIGFVGLHRLQRRRRRRQAAGGRGSTPPPSPPKRRRRPPQGQQSPPTPSRARRQRHRRRARATRSPSRSSRRTGASWISAKDHNGRLLFDGTLEQGESKTFTDNKKIDLVLGDAGAVQLFVNGKEIGRRVRAGSGRASHLHQG